jgi:AraC-like DNA-binding protein
VNGETIPAIFFPLQGTTQVFGGDDRQDRSVQTGGCFTVARESVFAPQPGYSERVLVVEPSLLRYHMQQLEIREPMEKLLRRAAMRTDLRGLARLKSLALDAFSCCEGQSTPFARLYAPLLAETLALHVAQVLGECVDQAGPSETTGSASALARAADYILARLSEPLMIGDIAAAAGVSVRRLQSMFQQTHGCSPRDFILAQRLARARNLLDKRLVDSVTDAALESGLAHLGRFSVSYASRFGESPSATLRRRT